MMATAVRVIALVGVGLCQALLDVAEADDSTEFWPEVNAFVPLGSRTRVHLSAAYAEGKESDTRSLDLAAYLDVSLKPITRNHLQDGDWQRSRYFWTRVGYTRVFKATDESAADVTEDRGVISFLGKAPLPAAVWLEARARADLRWIGGEYSTRYRFRLEASREFEWLGRTLVPYANAESFYDTRYDGWSRGLFQGGAELEMSNGFRWETYLARQIDRLPSSTAVTALGVVAKWYR